MDSCSTSTKSVLLLVSPWKISQQNFDQTNVMFTHDAKRTLSHKGAMTVSALKVVSTLQCTEILRSLVTGHSYLPTSSSRGGILSKAQSTIVLSKSMRQEVRQRSTLVWSFHCPTSTQSKIMLGYVHGWLLIGSRKCVYHGQQQRTVPQC
jgi:hypothetical protein